MPVDVALVMVSRPDKHGFCSFGTSSDFTKPVADCARIVIAQVNEHMPRTFGGNLIHVRDIDFIVEHSEPILEMQPANVGILENKIGKYCSSLIKDGRLPPAWYRFYRNLFLLSFGIKRISDFIPKWHRTV